MGNTNTTRQRRSSKSSSVISSNSRINSLPQLNHVTTENEDEQFMHLQAEPQLKSILRSSRERKNSVVSEVSTVKSVAFEEIEKDKRVEMQLSSLAGAPQMIHIPRLQYVQSEPFTRKPVPVPLLKSSTLPSPYVPPQPLYQAMDTMPMRDDVSSDANSLLSNISAISLPRYAMSSSVIDYRQEMRFRQNYKKMPPPQFHRTTSLMTPQTPQYGPRLASIVSHTRQFPPRQEMWEGSDTSSTYSINEPSMIQRQPRRTPFKAFALTERGIADGDSFADESDNDQQGTLRRHHNAGASTPTPQGHFNNVDMRTKYVREATYSKIEDPYTRSPELPYRHSYETQELRGMPFSNTTSSIASSRNSFSNGSMSETSDSFKRDNAAPTTACRFKARPKLAYVRAPSLLDTASPYKRSSS